MQRLEAQSGVEAQTFGAIHDGQGFGRLSCLTSTARDVVEGPEMPNGWEPKGASKADNDFRLTVMS